MERLNTIDNFHYQELEYGNNIINAAIIGMADSDPELLLDVVLFLGKNKSLYYIDSRINFNIFQ